MDDADPLHATMALVARGVQRMADSFGALEQRLERVEAAMAVGAGAGDARIERLTDAIRALRDDLATATTQLETRIAERAEPAEAPVAPAPDAAEVDRLVDAVRALRDDLATATAQLEAQTTATVERSANEHGARLAQLREAIIEMRDAIPIDLAPAPVPPPALPAAVLPPELGDLAGRLDAIDAALVTVRQDIAAATSPLDAEDPLEPRLRSIETAVTHLRDDLAIDRLEVSLRQMGGELERVSSDTSDLRNDVRRSFDRVLSSITAAEDHVLGEVKAIDHRLGGMADDLRLVRGLRDGLEALAGGVDAVRILASKGATSQQMGELGRDLTALLAEIESARSQVLAVDQQVSQPGGAIDVTPAIERLEQAVGDDVDELGRRIEQLAAAVEAQQQAAEAPPDVTDAIASRLRGLATGARQLRLGITEDLRSRKKTTKKARQR